MAYVSGFKFTSEREEVTKDKLNNLVEALEDEFNGSIDSTNLAEGSITSNSIAEGAITTDKLGLNSVTGPTIINGAVDLTSKVTGILPVANGGVGTGIYVKADGTVDLINDWTIYSNSIILSAGSITAKDLYSGDGTDIDCYYYANNADAPKPSLRYSASGNKWQYSNNGTSFSDIGSGGAGGDSDSVTKEITQSGHGLSVTDVVYLDGTEYNKARANDADTSEAVGIIKEVTDVNTFTILTSGFFTDSGIAASGTNGDVAYVDPDSDGGIVYVQPASTDNIIKPIGHVTDEGILIDIMRGNEYEGDSVATDEKIKVSSNDTTAGYLDAKLLAGSNITLTVGNEGVNETLTISGNTSTTRSGVSVTMDADEDFAANVTEDIPFDVEDLDVANEFNTTTNTFTAANEGIYSVFLHLVFSSLTRTNGNSRVFLVTTGIGSISEYLSLNGNGIYKADVPITYDFHALMSLAATETIKAQIRGGSADSGTIESSMSYMTIVRVN